MSLLPAQIGLPACWRVCWSRFVERDMPQAYCVVVHESWRIMHAQFSRSRAAWDGDSTVKATLCSLSPRRWFRRRASSCSRRCWRHTSTPGGCSRKCGRCRRGWRLRPPMQQQLLLLRKLPLHNCGGRRCGPSFAACDCTIIVRARNTTHLHLMSVFVDSQAQQLMWLDVSGRLPSSFCYNFCVYIAAIAEL